MNRKHNPLVSLVGLLLGLLLVILCAGCGVSAEATEPCEPAGESARFTIERPDGAWSALYIITDTETGVQYLMYHDAYGTGMTVLQDGEG